MFPWLPFLSLHNGDPNYQKRKRRPGSRKHSSLSSVWLNVDSEDTSIGTVRVEYLPVPFQPHRYTATASSSTDLGFGSTTATVTSEHRADSAPLGDLLPQNVSQEQHRHGKRSTNRPETPTRSTSAASNPRPESANAQQSSTSQVNQLPAQPRTNRRGRMFETSSAMLEIFGGAPTQSYNDTATTSQTVATSNNESSRPNFGRSRTEWEPLIQPTVSSFQTIPDHDEAYNRAMHRGNWDGAQSSFNPITHITQREISPMRQRTDETSNCPAENELRKRSRSGHLGNGNTASDTVRDSSLECPLQNGRANSEIQQPVKKREGVAELLGGENVPWQWQRTTQCGFQAADAAGQPSTSNGVYNTEADSPVEKDHLTPQSNGSPVENHQLAAANSADLHKPQLNGTHPELSLHLNGNDKVDEKAEERQRLFILSVYEDGCGMVAASGNGASESTTPILIRNASIVNDDAIFAADVLIADGQIRQILPGLEAPENAEIIDASGKWLVPAGIDLHCELDSADDLSNATKDALSGGTTTIVNVVKAYTDNESLLIAFDRAKSLVDSKAECNVALSVQIRRWSLEVKTQVEEICQKRGINNFVLDVQSDAELFEAMEHLKKLGAFSRVLPENRDIVLLLEKQFSSLQPSDAYLKARPAQLEAERIHRLCVLAQLNNVPFSVLSISSSEACRAVQTGRQQGALVSAEVPISALAADSLSSSAIQSRIPIRSGGTNSTDALELLANGPLSVCVSDHASVKRGKLPIGAISVGERLAVLWEKAVASGQIDLMRFVAVTSTNAAKLFNFYPKKGRIAVGADADLVLWDAQKSHRISSRNQNEKNNFDGLTVNATPEITICGGKIVYRNGKLTLEKASESRFVSLQPNAPHIFSVVQLRDKTLNLSKPNLATTIRNDSANSNGNTSEVRATSRDRGNTPQESAIQPEKQRPITKVIHPPGGRSTGFW